MSGRPSAVVIKPPPHRGQLQLLNFLTTHRFVLACCGRRFGKTIGLLMDMLRESVNYPNINAWWVDAIHYLARRAFRIMSKVVAASYLATPENISKSELRIELITGSVMEFHSAERGDRLRGEGVHRAYLNEASLIKAELWYEALYPMLTDTGGRAAFAFTPKGQGHWTYKEFLKGQSAESPDYASIQLPTSANPHIDPKFIEAAKKDLPAESFRQEYLAEFLPDSSGVFRNIDACTKGELDSPHTVPVNGPYAGGLDLAKHEDYTVLDILDARGRLAWHDRFQRQNWPVMKARIIEAAKRYRAHLVVESNSIGDVIIDDLREAGVSCEGFATTGSSKQGLIQGLMTALEQSLITFPSIPELIIELKIFEYDRLPSGAIRYQAPEGAHDDEVIALALAVRAWRGMSRGKDDDWLDGADLDQVLGRRAA
ncbi:MAG: phage terminase large subunit [Desulfarculaceae bacterium]|nr:phage terminase large subunit [Desulfarculaceae bacterium]